MRCRGGRVDLFNSFRYLLRCAIIALVLCSAQNAFSGAAEKWDYEVKPDKSKNIVVIEAKRVNIPAANDSRYKVRVSPSKSVVSRTMMRRLFRRANPLIGVSTMAVEALLSSYGYKIDDEEQIIYRDIGNLESDYYYLCDGNKFTNINDLAFCLAAVQTKPSWVDYYYKNVYPTVRESSQGVFVDVYGDKHSKSTNVLISPATSIVSSVGYKNNESTDPKREVLTEEKLGEIMFGRHPDTGKDTGVWTGIKEAYERIPNEIPASDEAPYFIEQILEKSNPDSNSNEVIHTDPETGKQTNSALPNFCDWATPICSFVEWFKDDSDIPEPEKYTISELDKSKLPTAPQFNFNNQCPAPKTFALNLGMASTQISLPYDYFCSFAVDVRPFVILAAWLHACYIFVGFVRS